MYLEYNWTANAYQGRYGHVWIDIRGWRSFKDLAEADTVLAWAHLKRGRKTDTRTWEGYCIRFYTGVCKKQNKGTSTMSRKQRPTNVFGYNLDADMRPIRKTIDTSVPGDYGADPLGDGRFKMVPSGDIVNFEERNRRLKRE